MADYPVEIPDEGSVSWSDLDPEPEEEDVLVITMESGGNDGIFEFDIDDVIIGGIEIEAGKNITLDFGSTGVQIKGDMTNLYQIRVFDTSNGEVLADFGDIEMTWQSRADVLGIVIGTASGVFTLTGSGPHRIFSYEAGRGSLSGHQFTDLGPVYGYPVSGGKLEAVFAHVLQARNLLKSSTLSLTDSEYWFMVTEPPEEQIVAGTWEITRSLISSELQMPWYIKPTGTLTIEDSFFDHALPVIYSPDYYIVLFQQVKLAPVKYRPPVEAETVFLGSNGSYAERLANASSELEISGRLQWADLDAWAHPLVHRLFIAQMMALGRDLNAFVTFIWHEGYWPVASVAFQYETPAGFDAQTGIRYYKLSVKERPYNEVPA